MQLFNVGLGAPVVQLLSQAWARKPFGPVTAGVVRTHLYGQICQDLGFSLVGVCGFLFFFSF